MDLGKSYRIFKADGCIIDFKTWGGEKNLVEILATTSPSYQIGDKIPIDVLYAGGFLGEILEIQ
ncbi:MAG: hypothetical protein JNK69_03515 [Saprospiraceae bacterium]|nr:hypothetical protein [Saprospiraceae bacterium]